MQYLIITGLVATVTLYGLIIVGCLSQSEW